MTPVPNTNSGLYYAQVEINLIKQFTSSIYYVAACSKYSTGYIFACGCEEAFISKFSAHIYDFYDRDLSTGDLRIRWFAIGL